MPEPQDMSNTAPQSEAERLIDSVNVRSEELQEVIGMIPPWPIRWGITIVFMVLALLLVGSWIFRYPDVVSAAISVTTSNPPVTIVARASGKIQHLLVKDNQSVVKDQYLAVLENAASLPDVIGLKKRLADFRRFADTPDSNPIVTFPKNYGLGEMQSSYETFLKSLADYLHVLEINYYPVKLASLNAQLLRQKEYCKTLSGQIDNYAEDQQLAKNQYERAESLFKEGIISKAELDYSQSAYLQKKNVYETAQTNLTQGRIQINRLDQEVEDLKFQDDQQKTQLRLVLKQSYDNLLSTVLQWEHSYVLKSPIAGLVTFTKYWSINQNITLGEKVVSIVSPEMSQVSRLIGRVFLPIQGAGKVKVGQKVRVKFADYPFMEFGLVWAEIRSKSLVAVDSLYTLEVSFPEGLKTSYGKVLEFFQEMQGTAEIITENKRLIERFFSPFKLLLTQNRGG